MSKIINNIKIKNRASYSWKITTPTVVAVWTATTLTKNDTILINQGNISWNTGVVTLYEAGPYFVVYNLTFSNSNNGYREAYFEYSGDVSARYAHQITLPVIGVYSALTGSDIINCVANSNIRLRVRQTSSIPLNVPESTNVYKAAEISVHQL